MQASRIISPKSFTENDTWLDRSSRCYTEIDSGPDQSSRCYTEIDSGPDQSSRCYTEIDSGPHQSSRCYTEIDSGTHPKDSHGSVFETQNTIRFKDVAIPAAIVVDHLIDVLKSNPKVYNTGTGALKHALVGASGIFLGGLLGGPLGAMIGGTIGLCVGYAVSHDYDSLIVIVKNLSVEEKEELAMKVKEHFKAATIEALDAVIYTKFGVPYFSKFVEITIKKIKQSRKG